ncbi:MAG: ribosome small subunit-dependent GTPase A, partial [Lachnospiraceae bacterium]|nr:ribosome small subunit-dependent GTPase A [Lachnospiraceae bacterium]
MQGRIIRGVGGFYYVHVPDQGVYECRARGIFRKEKIKPLVGDSVRIHVTDPKDMEGSLDEIFPRKNLLIRPASANV